MIGGSIEIPRMISGLWQLAGGHDKDISIKEASEAMDILSVPSSLALFEDFSNKMIGSRKDLVHLIWRTIMVMQVGKLKLKSNPFFL